MTSSGRESYKIFQYHLQFYNRQATIPHSSISKKKYSLYTTQPTTENVMKLFICSSKNFVIIIGNKFWPLFSHFYCLSLELRDLIYTMCPETRTTSRNLLNLHFILRSNFFWFKFSFPSKSMSQLKKKLLIRELISDVYCLSILPWFKSFFILYLSEFFFGFSIMWYWFPRFPLVQGVSYHFVSVKIR